MKGSFDVDSQEMIRILEMHKNAIKNYYLKEQGSADINDIRRAEQQLKNASNNTKTPKNVVTQTIKSYTTKNTLTFEQDISTTDRIGGLGTANELKLFKGATFYKSSKDPKKLVTTNAVFQFVNTTTGKLAKSWDSDFTIIPVNAKEATFYGSKGDYLYYGCDTGKFTTRVARSGNKSVNFYAEDGQALGLVNTLKRVCSHKPEVEKSNNNKPKVEPTTTTTTTQKVKKETYKPEIIQIPNLPAEKICNLIYDKVWSYTKREDGKWFASKDKKNWYELFPSKFQKAIDKLEVEGACKAVAEDPVLNSETKEVLQNTNQTTTTTTLPQQNLTPKSTISGGSGMGSIYKSDKDLENLLGPV